MAAPTTAVAHKGGAIRRWLKANQSWLIPAGFLALTAVPVLAGALRVTELAGGPRLATPDTRFNTQPLPVLVHIFSASLYCTLGAFQFSPAIRRRWPGWHRAAGRLLVPSGIAAALAGLWMSFLYPRLPGDGLLLQSFRLVFGTAMIASIVLGFAAIRRRDVTTHRRWMARAYAIAQGAGTQVLTNLPWLLIVGKPAHGAPRAWLLLAGWVINVAVAEWILRRRRPAMTRRLHTIGTSASQVVHTPDVASVAPGVSTATTQRKGGSMP